MAMTPSVDNLEKQLASVLKELKRYEDGRLALTKKEVSELHDQRRTLPQRIEQACPHLETHESIENWTDTGYGPDIEYEEYIRRCNRCNKNLGEIRPGARAGTKASQDLFKAVNEQLFRR